MRRVIDPDWRDVPVEPIVAMTRVLMRPTRERIVVKIALGATTARELAQELNLPVSTVRDNLRALESVGIATKSVRGGTARYRLGRGVSARTTDKEVVIRLKPPGKGSLEVGHPLTWLSE